MKVEPIIKIQTNNNTKTNKENKDVNKSFRDILASIKNK